VLDAVQSNRSRHRVLNGNVVISGTEAGGVGTMLTTYNSAFTEFSFTKAFISSVKVLTTPTI